MSMDELVKTFRHFLVRDAIYIVGGGLVVTSFLYRFGELPPTNQNWPLAPSLLAAGIAYVIGHAIQDGFSLTGLSTTAWLLKPNWIIRKLCGRFERERWEEPPFEKVEDLKRAAVQIQNEEAKADLQRIISLMMIGTTMAPCFFISSLFVIWKWIAGGASWEGGLGFDSTLAITGLGFSLVFWALGGIKNAQRTRFVAAHTKHAQATAADQPAGKPSDLPA